MIETAYREGERLGLALWCEDEAGPYQTIPQPGQRWQRQGEPARYPHEYIRGGTAKRLMLFHPATGQVRVKGVSRSTNGVLHPWLKEELSAILAALPVPAAAAQCSPASARMGALAGRAFGPLHAAPAVAPLTDAADPG